MSELGRWTYTNTATVKPHLGFDEWGNATYGPEYTIACTWGTNERQQRGLGGQSGAEGAELTAENEIYTEDARPKRLDLILLNGHDDWQEIRQRVEWDMSPFDDVPDYKLVT